jgi:hypothetical protein
MPQNRPIARCCALILMLVVVSASPSAQASDPPTFADRADEDVRDADRTFALLLNPLAMAVGVFGAEADFVLGRFAALAVEGDLYRRGDGTATALGAGLLFYPMGTALHGPYLQTRVAYARPLGETLSQVDWSVDVVALGATAGWHWTWDYGFSVRLGGGAMYFLGASRDRPSDGPLALGPQLVLDGSLGWAF